MPMKPNIQAARAGQTVIEFALVSVVFIFMLVLTVNAVLAFSVQQYLSYAAFMTARAYQASGATGGDSQLRARRTLARYVPGLQNGGGTSGLNIPLKFELFAKPLAYIRGVTLPQPTEGVVGQDRPNSSVAIRINFDVPLVQFPLSAKLSEKFALVPLVSESYLGREVSQAECREFFNKFIKAFALGGGSNRLNAAASQTDGKYMEDNGC